MVFGTLTHVLIQSMCDLKTAQMIMQYNLIQELILYKFKLSNNTAEATHVETAENSLFYMFFFPVIEMPFTRRERKDV